MHRRALLETIDSTARDEGVSINVLGAVLASKRRMLPMREIFSALIAEAGESNPFDDDALLFSAMRAFYEVSALDQI